MLARLKRPGPFVLAAALAPTGAGAMPLEAELVQGTDGGGRTLFVPNPAAYLPEKSAVSFGEVVQDHSVRYTTNSDQGPASAETAFNELTRSVGFTLASGGKFALGLQGNFRKEEIRSKFTNSNFANTPLEEYRWHREGVGRVALEFTEELKAGLLFRYQYRKADVLGSFNGGNSDRTQFSGSLYGLGVGALFQAKSGAVGAAYVTPLRGKVEVTGEKKVTTDPGFMHGSAYFDVSPMVRIGGVYERWLHEKDELARTTTGPDRQRQLTVDLRGVNPDRFLYLRQRVMVGGDLLLTKASGLRLTASRDTYEFVFDPDTLPGEEGNEDNVLNGYRGRAAVLFGTDLVGLQFGVDYARRTHKPKPNRNSDIDYKASELNFFGILNFNI